MKPRGERNVGLSLIAAGIGVIAFAIIAGLTTPNGGPDWVGIITVSAGSVVLATGLFTAFRSGSTHTK